MTTEPIKRKLELWAADHLPRLRGRQPELPDALSDRAQDVWEPLFAIAEEIGGNWPSRARQAALILSAEAVDDDDIAVQLLADCRIVFGGEEKLASKALAEALVGWKIDHGRRGPKGDRSHR